METLHEMVEKMRPQLEKQLAADMTKQVAESLSWSLSSKVKEIAGDYITKNVMPDVLKDLESRHDEIVLGIVGAVQVAATDLGTSLAVMIGKNLATDYKMRQIAKALFD